MPPTTLGPLDPLDPLGPLDPPVHSIPVADERIRVEDMDLAELCVKYELGTHQDCHRPVPPASIKRGGHGGETDSVGWEELVGIDPDLAAEMWDMARAMGYSRDPPV